MNEIINIKVVQKTIDDEKKRFVNARELHRWLKVGKFFANWIKDRIEKYDFAEGADFFKVMPHKELKQAKSWKKIKILISQFREIKNQNEAEM